MGLFQFFMVIIMILGVLLVLIILSQNPKGGGLSSTFGGGGGSQMFGVQRTNKFLDNTTWGLFIAIIVLIIGASATHSNPNKIPTIKQTTQPANNLPAQPAANGASQNNLPAQPKK
ncbi:preprotein translocase subunit SecG [Chishuiella sp.]|uniref:preprotein translocase subunit SecG n=1 Tax=Chishuiella sp. TaxID=1969467 RepID=UPI0028B10752|nr:preprotein translocase subunit SecG [Chishuiella sp.]